MSATTSVSATTPPTRRVRPSAPGHARQVLSRPRRHLRSRLPSASSNRCANGSSICLRPADETALPFVIVISRDLVPTEAAMETVVDSRGKPGVVNMDPVSPDDFKPKDGVEIPAGQAYLLADVDLGARVPRRPPQGRAARHRGGRPAAPDDRRRRRGDDAVRRRAADPQRVPAARVAPRQPADPVDLAQLQPAPAGLVLGRRTPPVDGQRLSRRSASADHRLVSIASRPRGHARC